MTELQAQISWVEKVNTTSLVWTLSRVCLLMITSRLGCGEAVGKFALSYDSYLTALFFSGPAKIVYDDDLEVSH